MRTANDFVKYQAAIVERFSRILAASGKGKFDEQALPAYTNSTLIMRWLFWERIKTVISYLDSQPELGSTMDFGCGLGVMLPYLNQRTKEVLAVDLDVSLLRELGDQEGWTYVKYFTDFAELSSLYQGKLNLILALDVLEHVEHLEETLLCFKRLLKSSGVVVVSGPTESFWYKLGRLAAGYSGDYHQRNIYDILDTMQAYFKVDRIATLLPWMPLFIVACGKLPDTMYSPASE